MDFDAFDQGADDLALRVEIDRAQPVIDGGRKIFETIDHQKQLEKQLELPCLMSLGLFNLTIDLLQLDLQRPDLWIEVRFIDNTLRVAIDES